MTDIWNVKKKLMVSKNIPMAGSEQFLRAQYKMLYLMQLRLIEADND